jgi:4a-hydroxytetrahydrobiopterin dehydratase
MSVCYAFIEEASVTEQALGKLSDDQIAAQLENFPEWAELNGQIQRTFQFEDFDQSVGFVNRIAEYAEQVQHHPDILIRYNKVTLTVSTHDAGGITHKDFELAKTANSLVA